MQGISLGNSATGKGIDFQEKITQIKSEIEALAHTFGVIYDILDHKCEELVKYQES